MMIVLTSFYAKDVGRRGWKIWGKGNTNADTFMRPLYHHDDRCFSVGPSYVRNKAVSSILGYG
jgi:hypothetical protein